MSGSQDPRLFIETRNGKVAHRFRQWAGHFVVAQCDSQFSGMSSELVTVTMRPLCKRC